MYNMNSMHNMNNMNCQHRAMLLRKVQQHNFAMVDAVLYLDGHPNCRKALEYFSRQKAAYEKYAAEYEEKYGPLTPMSGVGCDSWKWIQGPWPWESEAN